MENNFYKKHFRWENLKTEEWVVVIIYLLLSLLLYLGYTFDVPQDINWLKWMLFYTIAVPFMIIGAQYRNLRNPKYYLIWVAFAILQMLFYQLIKDVPELNFERGSALTGLRSLLPALIVFQLFRVYLLRRNGRDLIISLRKGRMTRWEPEENRNMSNIEIAFSMLIALTIVAFAII
jgi:hypothetical protein